MRIFLFLVFFVIFEQVLSIDCPQKSKGIRGLRTRLTTYITTQQAAKVLNIVENQLWNNQTAEQIMTSFPMTVISVLTFTQTLELGSKSLKCTSESGLTLTELLSKVGMVLKNNIVPFMSQITHLMTNLRTKKQMKQYPIFVIVYRKFNQFILKKNIGFIMCRMAENFTEQQWTAIRNNLGSLFLLSLYPCTQ